MHTLTLLFLDKRTDFIFILLASWKQFPHTLHLSFPRLQSSTTHLLKLNLKCQKAFFLSLLILPFFPTTPSSSISFLPPLLPLSLHPSVLCLPLHRWPEQLSKARGGRRKGSVYPKQHIRTDTHD